MRSTLCLLALALSACGSAHLVTGSPKDGGAGGTAMGGGTGGAMGGGASGGGAVGGGATGGGTSGGGVAGGGVAGGGQAGGVVGGGTAGGGSAGGGSASCTATSCPTGCCLNGTCQPGTQPLACGTGGVACAQCMTGDACSTAQTCILDPQSQWTVHPASAAVNSSKPSGSGWDSFGGAPDPYVDLYCPASASSITDSSSSVDNSYQPTWSDGECTVTADQLMTTGFAFAVFDSDGLLGGADDSIAPKTTKVLTEAELRAGMVSHGATSGLGSIQFSLTRVP